MRKLFGTDGMRGEAGIFPLNREAIMITGWSLAQQYQNKFGRTPKFITGRDTRESGEWIEMAFHQGAILGGAVCQSVEVMTTPGVAFLTKKFGFDAGIVISASHNPYQDNGIKIFLPSGKKLESETEMAIENDIFAKLEEKWHPGSEIKINTDNAHQFQDAYLDYLHNEFNSLKLNDLTIVVDCANGASSDLAPRLFSKFGANVVAIHHSPDGKNINYQCGSTHIEKLLEAVTQEKADFGVAFDGDADRALFVDENGKFVDGDATLWAMAQHLQNHGKLNKDTVVATVMSNIGLEKALDSIGVKLLRTPVGDKYVLQALLETETAVGGEQSGHIIFPEKSLVGDGMMTALYLLETIFETGKSLSGITKGFLGFPQILVNVKVNEKRPFEEVAEIVAASQQVEKELGSEGRLLLRYSGTENLARVMIEGSHQTEIERQANWLAGVIKDALNK